MSFSPIDPNAPVFQDALRRNGRVFLCGVERYDNFPGQTVESATNNVLSWLLTAMRMGINPDGNPIALGQDAVAVQALAADVITSADVSQAVRDAATQLIGSWLGRAGGDNPLMKPTFESLLTGVGMGYHLKCYPDTRMLRVFSGHGALDGVRFVLCPQDTVPNPTPRSPAELRAEVDAALVAAEARVRARHPGADGTDLAADGRAAVTVALDAAEAKGVAAELADFLLLYLSWWGVRFNDSVYPDIIRFFQGNLAQIPSQRGRPAPTLGRVLTPIHLMIGLGKSDERVTVVLDACHSGGLGEAVQGSEVAHDWTALGLRCRIISSGQKAQRSAEATLGDRRYSAATWALTRVLSRWAPVEDGPAYAMGITNGNLILRANLLLDALSFNQQIGLSSPAPARTGQRKAADMPFLGMQQGTETTVDPNAAADGIQLSSGTNTLTIWELKQSGTLRAVLLAVGSNSESWKHGPQTYAAGKLYVIGGSDSASNLQSAGFSMTMTTGTVGDPAFPTAIGTAVAAFSDNILATVNASGDEVTWSGSGPAANTAGAWASYQKSGRRRVWMRWIAASGGSQAKLVFVLQPVGGGVPVYDPNDFEPGSLTFSTNTNPSFNTTCKMHIIELA